jgi:hypothetical protein
MAPIFPLYTSCPLWLASCTVVKIEMLTASPNSVPFSGLPPEYAIPAQAPSLGEALAYCERLARRHYENFSVATWFLPERVRPHFYSVYAYCRISDDLGDEVGDPRESLRLLNEWEEELNATSQPGSTCSTGHSSQEGGTA